MATLRITRPFRRLRGKLMLSYTLTSVVTFLLIEQIFIGSILTYVSLNVSRIVLNNLKQQAPQAAPYFTHGSPDPQAMTEWLRIVSAQLSNQGPFSNGLVFLAVAGTKGDVIASIGTRPLTVGTRIEEQLSPQGAQDLRSVLSDATGSANAISDEADGTLVAVVPIVSPAGDPGAQQTSRAGVEQGILIMKAIHPDVLQLVSVFLGVVLVTGLIVTAIAGVAGLVFGYLTARGITRRLKALSTAANSWSRGDFSVLAEDPSDDEVGQTARRLNGMAQELQNLLQTRQALATLEERNRLARDLHDSVKQQIFALAMQIGATKILIKRDPAAAEMRLGEADKLVRQAQQELTTLIRELRPAALEGKGLVAALHELAVQWAEQTCIVANLQVEGTQSIPAPVEEALFRVAQEALSNVNRHSKATVVQMLLVIAADTITLSVSDNGAGFDTTGQMHSGVGLLSMQERMRELDGDVRIESTPGSGTHVIAYCKRLSTKVGANGDRWDRGKAGSVAAVAHEEQVQV